MLNRSFFITGTDTNVGKTTMTAALILALQHQGKSVGVLKPLETGVAVDHHEPSDTERLRHLLSPPPSFDSVCLYAFPQPLAPLAAARTLGTTIDLARIRSHMHELTQRCSFLLIEGAGGIFTPLTPQHTIRDLITLLHVPCLIVGSTHLGGVNHCLLTLEALQQAGIRLCGIVLNESDSTHQTAITRQQQASTIELIREWSSFPVFGPIGFTRMVERNWQEGVNQLAGHSEIQRLATHLSETVPETG
ncbi:MAG: dethiobiotin synthase [Nitrospirota bacterium]